MPTLPIRGCDSALHHQGYCWRGADVAYEVSVSLDKGLRRTVEWLTEWKGAAEESS